MTAQALLSFFVFFFPGVLLFFRRSILSGYSPGEKLLLAVSISFAYWIIGFWWLTIVPIPLTLWVYLSLGAGALSVGWLGTRRKPLTGMRIGYSGSIPFFLFLVVIIIPQLLLMWGQVVPSGSDMSMHTYIASVILRANQFPNSMAPLVPVDHFGLYPFGFSTLTAVMGIINGLPAFTNALLLSSIAHLLFDYALYLILRARFSPLISAMAAVMVGWVSYNPHLYIAWGANPSVLSLAFLFLAVALGIAGNKPTNKWLIVLFITASFLTNYMFVIAGLYIALPVIVMLLITSGKKMMFLKNIFWGVSGFCILTLPLIGKTITSAWQIPDATRKFVQALHYEEIAAWTGAISLKGFGEIIGIIMGITDQYLILFFGLSCILLFRNYHKTVLLLLYVTGMVCVFIVNARHWWLPWSSVLYPYRTTLILLIPIAWGAALLFDHLKKKNPLVYAMSVMVVLIVFLPRLQFFRFLTEAKAAVSVTRTDMTAMTWLASHSNEQDVIWNRYEDAGLWIPAIISRPISLYHTNPVDLSLLASGATRLPTFAFIGATVAQERPIAEEVATMFPEALLWRFDIVYHNGDTAIYRIIR